MTSLIQISGVLSLRLFLISDVEFDVVTDQKMSCPGDESVNAMNTIEECARKCDGKSSVYFGFVCTMMCICNCYPGRNHHNDCVNDDLATFLYKIVKGRYHFI